MFSIIETCPRRLGCADKTSAMPPATWGVAIDVPLKLTYELTVFLLADLVLVPGAAMSGFMRLLPSTVTGPRLLKDAMLSVPVLSAPTVKDSAYIAGGSDTV